MIKDNFAKLENRENTMSIKWDMKKETFGTEDILPLWVADSDWKTSTEVRENLVDRAENGILGYSFADQSIEEAVQRWYKKRFNLDIKKEWLVFGTGVVPSINFALKTITEAGDGVIIQPPVYKPFFSAVEINNCSLIKNDLKYENNYYQMDFDDLKNQIKEFKENGKNVKAMILCSPHNPVGRVWSEAELVELLRILKKEDIYLISDEIHFDLVYSTSKHIPILELLERDEFKDYQDKLISFSSPSKTFNIAGLHTSYTLIKSKKLRNEYIKSLEGFETSNSPFGLIALKTAYNQSESWLDSQLEYLEANYEYLKKYLAENIPEIKVTEAEGTYLAWLNFSGLNFKDDEELIDFMNNKAKVGLNPGRWFGDNGSMFMRLNLACPRKRLEKALTRIKDAFENRK